MDDKVKLTKCQNHHHRGGVFDTCTMWTRPQAEWAQGPAGQGLRQFGLSLGCHTSTRGGEAQVSKEHRWRPLHRVGHVAWPADHHLAPN
jgi:hypothetical protein